MKWTDEMDVPCVSNYPHALSDLTPPGFVWEEEEDTPGRGPSITHTHTHTHTENTRVRFDVMEREEALE